MLCSFPEYLERGNCSHLPEEVDDIDDLISTVIGRPSQFSEFLVEVFVDDFKVDFFSPVKGK
ncbi:hypothetical protein FJZ31_01220 [Candidatus Poribacteria bacterium]|nr:hypothetical protein [Candidatus Poribacteria bacterium]